MNELAIFAGAGGGILGGHLLGWRTVCAVELEPYPASVLAQRQNDGILPPFPIWDDVRTFDGRPWRRLVDVVSGGFPCQDISAAGNGAGITGSRSGLWREMHRIICDVRPRFAFVENSPMLASRGLGQVLGDLAESGYDAEWMVLGADDVGAPHIRKRIWILAMDRDANGDIQESERQISGGWEQTSEPQRICGDVANADCLRKSSGTEAWNEEGNRISDRRNDVSDAKGSPACGLPLGEKQEISLIGKHCQNAPNAKFQGLERQRRNTGEEEISEPGDMCSLFPNSSDERNVWRDGELSETASVGKSGDIDMRRTQADGSRKWWSTEPDVGRVAHGVAARVDRLKAIGNGQVPAVAAVAFGILRGRFERSEI